MMTSRLRVTYIVVMFLFIKHLTPLYTLHLLKENTLVSKGFKKNDKKGCVYQLFLCCTVLFSFLYS